MLRHTRYDDFDHLKSELEQERRYRESIEWSNAELERSIGELEVYLRDLETNTRSADDNEWKVRFESQAALNKQFQEQKEWLEAELIDARRKLTTGSYPEALNYNLDVLNEPELLRLVKHLERMRNDYYSTLRDTEWKLDKESKEFHHFDEMRRVYRSELKHANTTIERMRLTHVLDPSGLVSPIYPPGYFRWLDSHGGGGGSTSSLNKVPYGDGTKDKKSQGKSKGSKKSERDPSPTPAPQQPPRSKSRAEKKKKEPPKKEVVINETGGENGVGETDGNGTEGSGAEQERGDKQSAPSSSGAESFVINEDKGGKERTSTKRDE